MSPQGGRLKGCERGLTIRRIDSAVRYPDSDECLQGRSVNLKGRPQCLTRPRVGANKPGQ